MKESDLLEQIKRQKLEIKSLEEKVAKLRLEVSINKIDKINLLYELTRVIEEAS